MYENISSHTVKKLITFSNICRKEVIIVNILFYHLIERNHRLRVKERWTSAKQLCLSHLISFYSVFTRQSYTHQHIQMYANALLQVQMEWLYGVLILVTHRNVTQSFKQRIFLNIIVAISKMPDDYRQDERSQTELHVREVFRSTCST